MEVLYDHKRSNPNIQRTTVSNFKNENKSSYDYLLKQFDISDRKIIIREPFLFMW